MVPVAKELAARLVQRINDASELAIPPYPAVAAQLQRLPRETVKLSEVAAIIGTDTSLTANLLRQASSVQFGGIAPTTIEAALGKLGLDEVVRVAIAVALGKSAGAAGPLADLRRDEWRRSLLSAVFCRELASRRGVDPSQAFLSGLLHDFGTVVALACLEDGGQLPVMPAVTWRSVVDAVHVELGTTVAKRWHLAEPIMAVVAHHHAPANAPVPHRPLVQLVAMVDHIIAILDRGANTGIGALIEVPGLTSEERYRVGGLMPQIGEQLTKFELAAAQTSGSAVEPDDVLEDGWRVDFPVGSRREMNFKAVALSPNRLAIECPQAMSPGWLTELVVCESSPALQLLANVVACSPRANGSFLVVVQPFGLGGDQKKQWNDIIAKTRVGPGAEAGTRW